MIKKAFFGFAVASIAFSAPSMAQENRPAPKPEEATAEKSSAVQSGDPELQKLMLDLKRHLETLNAVIYGYQPANATDESVKAHVEMIRELAKQIPSFVKTPLQGGDTSQNAQYWKEKKVFTDYAEKINKSLSDFVSAVKAGDEKSIRESYKSLDLPGLCAGCHDFYRKK